MCSISASGRGTRVVTMKDEPTGLPRRAPRQQRSRLTVRAVLDAVTVVLKRHGPDAITTNRITEAAGVSIGSLYQYFPDKQAIYRALHQRHVDEVSRVIERVLAERASGSLEDFTRALVEGLADVHAADPELHQLVTALVPEGPAGFRAALHETFEHLIVPDDEKSRRILFVLPNLIESLVHALAERPSFISLESAKDEAVRTVLVYLESHRA
jgi:AcrR family transcriptional regulator